MLTPDSELPGAEPLGTAPSIMLDGAMTLRDYDIKLAELDRLLNDPDVPMEASRVWSLLAEISQQASPVAVPAG